MKNLKQTLKSILVLTLTIIVFSCNKDDGPTSTDGTTPTPPAEPTVYVVGYKNDGTNDIATLWKNGVETQLTDGTHDASANSIFIDGTDVYVAGFESNGTNRVAKLWKNGVATNLTNGLQFANAMDVYVKDNDVYVAGIESGVAKLWKNGSPHYITDGTLGAHASSVFVNDNGNIFVAFNEHNGTHYQAWYRRLGSPYSYLGSGRSMVNDFTMINNEIYAVGNEFNGTKLVAVIWNSSGDIDLTDGTNHGRANSIFIENNTVYVVGYEESNGPSTTVAKLWVGGTPTNLTDGTQSAVANAVFVKDNDVYVAGIESNGTNHIAKLWKNGVATDLSGDGTHSASATAIFVK